jgi:DNA-binding NtrC family response regulator
MRGAVTPFENTPPNPALRRKRIAVVEDEPPIEMILGIMLDELGCVQAGSARTLSEALAMSHGIEADAVLLDYRLKGEFSDAAAKSFLDRGIKVVLTTGADVRDLPDTFKDCSVIQKPFGLDTIERGLMEALRDLN